MIAGSSARSRQRLGLIEIGRPSQLAEQPPGLIFVRLLKILDVRPIAARFLEGPQSFLKCLDLLGSIEQRRAGD